MYPQHGGDAAQFSLLQGKKFDGKAAVVSPGTRNHAWTPEDCAGACGRTQGCLWFAYCASPSGCQGGHASRECWLYAGRLDKFLQDSHKDGDWVSGVRKTDLVAHSNAILEGTQTKTWLVNNDSVQSDGADRGRASAGGYESLAALGDASLPLVYLDIAIKDRAVGQIVILLFPQISPNYAENFRRLCTGDHASGDARFKDATVNMIVEDKYVAAGVRGGQSALGKPLPLDAGGLALKHDRKGLLTSASDVAGSADAEFWITLGPDSALDGRRVVFGEVLVGLEVLQTLNALARDRPGRNATWAAGAVIRDAGVIRNGTVVPQLDAPPATQADEDKIVDESPKDKAADESTKDKAADESTKDKAVDVATNDKPVDAATNDKPADAATNDKPVEATTNTDKAAEAVTSPASPLPVEQANRNARVMPEHAALRLNESLPLVYLDVSIKDKLVGRMEIVLFTDASPRHAENFRQLCTGEAGAVRHPKPGRPTHYHFQGAKFYRIVRNWINQGGVETDSVWGGRFADDAGGLALKHDRKGLLSSANLGPDTNEGHFSIFMGPSPHLDGHHTIFGQVVAGWEVNEAINALAEGKPENLATAADGVVITGSGQLRRGTLKPDLMSGLPANATGYNFPEKQVKP